MVNRVSIRWLFRNIRDICNIRSIWTI